MLCAPRPPPPFPRRAKYELQHVVRTNLAANDSAFNCVYEGEDEDGTRGVRLSKELMAIAGAAAGVEGRAAEPGSRHGRQTKATPAAVGYRGRAFEPLLARAHPPPPPPRRQRAQDQHHDARPARAAG
jgi:hypothetical protein